MDSRDLFDEIYHNEWNEQSKLIELLLLLPSFIVNPFNTSKKF